MNDSHGDTRRKLIGSDADNQCCLDGCTNQFERDNSGTLYESSEFLHVVHCLKSVTSSSGKVLLINVNGFSFVDFNERRNHRQSYTSYLCPNGLLTNVVVKHTLAAA
ncbi:hypothetical protein TNCT_556831 [Trichonephila clavata]|uniref:Uncharacterized protein n=1 Tax=Trichonephila clavata TaxID=2740835 RepID=A0A8X6H290_TRICU|nr:hypothetical protein TNCT_556831 [Trichonephila clavata]